MPKRSTPCAEKNLTGAISPRSVPLWWRCARFVLAFIVAPVALLGLGELGLRAADYGQTTRVFVKRELGGKAFYVSNRAFYEQFFSESIYDLWRMAEFQVPAEKDPNAYRVFVLGGSAVFGTPPDPDFSVSRFLEVMLRTRYPDRRIEVYTCAHPCLSSNVMWGVARACAKLQPDLFVVYMGNNEVNGYFGAVTTVGRRLPWALFFIRASMLLSDLRLAQLVTGTSGNLWRPEAPDFEPHLFLDDALLEKTYGRFRTNLEGICKAGAGAGCPVVLCTVGCNVRDWVPELSANRLDLSAPEKDLWEARYQAGIALEEDGAYDKALEAYTEAAKIDDTHGELQFRVGRCYWELEDYDLARAHFVRAWDSDLLRARVPRRINEIIDQTAHDLAGDGVHVVDAARILADHSPHQCVGREFFYDNVHLTLDGNYIVARAVFEQVARVLPHGVGKSDAGEREPLSQPDCERRLGMSPGVLLRHYRTVLQANELWSKQAMPHLEEAVATLEQQDASALLESAAEGYRQALELCTWDPVLRSRYVEALLDLGDTDAALEQARLLVSEFPYRRDSRGLLGRALAEAGETAQAVSAFNEALTLYPDDEAAKTGQAHALKELGRTEEAMAAYRDVIAMNPAEALAYVELDNLWVRQGNVRERLASWRQVARAYPRAPRAHFHLAVALEAAGDIEGAIAAYRKAGQLESADPAIPIRLGEALVKKSQRLRQHREYDAALALCREASAIDNSNPSAKCVEGDILKERGDMEGAAEAYQEGVSCAPWFSESYERLDDLYGDDTSGRVAAWRDVVSHQPEAAYAHFHLAMALAATHDFESAVAAFRKAAELEPSHQGFRRQFVDALAARGRKLQHDGRLEEAIDAFRKAQSLDKYNASLKCAEGELLMELGSVEEAAEALREALARDPSLPDPYGKLDDLLANDPERRAAEWRRTTAAHPDAARAHFHLGMAVEAMGDLDGAISAYRKAAALDTSDPAMQVRLGNALIQERDFEGAIGPLRTALQLNPAITHISPQLLAALCETKAYDAAWKEVARCKEIGVELPQEILERLARDSGRRE